MIHRKPARHAFVCGVLSCGVIACQAANVGPGFASSLPPPLRAAYLQRSAQAPAAAAKISPDSSVDVTPPVLTGFEIKPPADVGAPLAQIVATVHSTDDLSGVTDCYITLQGPHGQVFFPWVSGQAPATRSTLKFVESTSVYMEPGVWTITGIQLVDFAGNYAIYSGAALEAFGDTQVVTRVTPSR